MPVYRRLLPSSCWYPFILLGGERQVKSSVLPKDTIHGQQLDSNPGPSDLKLQTQTTAPRTSYHRKKIISHLCEIAQSTAITMLRKQPSWLMLHPKSWLLGIVCVILKNLIQTFQDSSAHQARRGRSLHCPIYGPQLTDLWGSAL